MSQQALARQAGQLRNSCHNPDWFRGNWWTRHPGAWRAERWAAAAAAYYGAANWWYYYDYCGYRYNTDPVYYDYGSSVVYESTNVYWNGEAVSTQQQFAEEAIAIADTGRQTAVNADHEWLSLGVFAMLEGERVHDANIFQLAVNSSGIIRGNYYNTLVDIVIPVYGAVDQKTQRAAWTIGERKNIVFEAGFANLSRQQTTMLVHLGAERTEQRALIRIEPPDTGLQ